MCKVQITKELLISLLDARQKYFAYLDKQKRDKSRKTIAMKRESIMDELSKLKKRELELRQRPKCWSKQQMSMQTRQRPQAN